MRRFMKLFVLLLGYILHRNQESKVIYYHDISTKYTDMGTPWKLFKRHIQIARDCGYKIVDCVTESHGQIEVCFDDGWAGIYDVKDEIISMGIHPTIFIAVDLIGKDGYLSQEQILELQNLGFIFEGHTWTHQDLTLLTTEELKKEILDSKNQLSSILGKEIKAICFPKGRFSDDIVVMCRKAGYTKLYSSLYANYYTLSKQNLICRLLCQSLGEKSFRFTINGKSNYLFMRFLKQQKAC